MLDWICWVGGFVVFFGVVVSEGVEVFGCIELLLMSQLVGGMIGLFYELSKCLNCVVVGVIEVWSCCSNYFFDFF